MDNLTYGLKELCRTNRDGSRATQAKRKEVLCLAAKQLRQDLGYRHLLKDTIKPKHVYALVALWTDAGVSNATIAGRMTHIRWWARKVGREHVVKQSNEAYGIGGRKYRSELSKAVDVADRTIEFIKDDYVQASLRLAKEFGLRKQEALLIHPSLADKGDHLWLKDTWCKGKRERTIPIVTESQRHALDKAKEIARNRSLIPEEKNLKQQLNHYEYITQKNLLFKLHGLRHRYAQLRYRELTGWESPYAGGPSATVLNAEQRVRDEEVRLQISGELGHGRISVVKTYLG
ncbi:MAG: integrase [Crocinitomicaceae bacterium]|nr:integrase [Crocinitomicaceae bacterium]